MLKCEGEITKENCQEHHLVDHETNYLNIASTTTTTYDQHIDNITDNAYCAHVYNTPSNPDSEFESDLNQRSEISKMMGSIFSVTKNDTPCEVFSDPIMVQLEELEGHICDIFCPEAVAHVKANIRAVQETRGKGVNNIQISKIWVVSEEILSKSIDKSTQLCKHHVDNSLSRQLSTINIIRRYMRIISVFFNDSLLAQTTLLTRGNKYSQLYVSDKGFVMI